MTSFRPPVRSSIFAPPPEAGTLPFPFHSSHFNLQNRQKNGDFMLASSALRDVAHVLLFFGWSRWDPGMKKKRKNH
jgi:hypothetical protein